MGVDSRVPRAGVREWLADDDGLTLIEALVAAVILAVGILGAFMVLTISLHASADVRARQGAVTLARQITEDARSIPYSQISGSTIVSQLQAMPGLASTSGSSWTIVRNKSTYTVTASVTAMSDPKDTSGKVDIKQVSATVNWTTYQGKAYSYTETATMTTAGQDPGLIASALSIYTSGTGISGTPTAPVITQSSVASLQFQVTAPTGTSAVVWTLNGSKQPAWAGTPPSSGSTWISNPWSISTLSDGTNQVGAQAEDSNGVLGPAVTISVRLIRNVPSAPTVTGYGFNPNFTVNNGQQPVAELQWTSNPEQNVVGYRVYGPGSSSTPICQTNTTTAFAMCGSSAWCLSATACIDLSPPSPGTPGPTYTVKALYYDANNNLREGSPTSVTFASGTPVPPPPPPTPTLTPQLDGTATLTWTPPSGGTPVALYRIYRDGNAYTSRYDTLLASKCTTTCTYHDTSRDEPHVYYVSSVGGTTPGSNMAESTDTPTLPASG
jgi:Tfp pilus assembly protein PilV